MIVTGLKKFDEYLGGGIPEGKSILFQIEPGMEETDIGLHILRANLDKFYGIYVSSKSSPKNIDKILKDFNFFRQTYKNFILIDGYSSLIGAPSDEEYIVEEPHDIRSYEDVITDVVSKIEGKKIIVFDSLSNIMDMCGENNALEGVKRINEEVGREKNSAVYNFVLWPYKEGVLYKLKRLFNSIIEVKSEGNRNRMHIKKVDWNGREKILEFKIFKPEGIRIYIPKIIVIGPFKAGKTTFLKAISKKFVPVERLGATVGMEYGAVDYKGYRAEVFGIPGQERFTPLIEKLSGSSMGVFLVIDSTKPNEFDMAKNMIDKFKGLPYVIIANKQDLPNALDENEIRQRLGGDAPIIKTVATSGQGIFHAFETLADMIVEWLNAR